MMFWKQECTGKASVLCHGPNRVQYFLPFQISMFTLGGKVRFAEHCRLLEYFNIHPQVRELDNGLTFGEGAKQYQCAM